MQQLTTIFAVAFVLFIFFARTTGKLPVLEDDDEDGNVLLSKKSKASKEGECAAKDKTCKSNNAKPKPAKTTPEMMDETSEQMVGLIMKYAKDIVDGKIDFKKLLQSDIAKTAMDMVVRGSLPGGNPTIAAGYQVVQAAMKSVKKMEKGLKTKGLNLKDNLDELHDIANQIMPGLVIAVQHADRKCRKQALCRTASTASNTKADFPRSVGIFLSYAAGSYLDLTEKSKKGEYIKIVECCSSTDKAIHKKCSAKYLDSDECPSERMLSSTMLQPIDYSQLEFVTSLLPKF